MTLRTFLEYYDNWNGYTVVNGKNLELYARVKTDRLFNGNYDKILKREVLSFGFYDGDLTVRIDY